MPLVHKAQISSNFEPVLVRGTMGYVLESMEVCQARCEACPWKGPRRTYRHEALDDCINHQKHPQED